MTSENQVANSSTVRARTQRRAPRGFQGLVGTDPLSKQRILMPYLTPTIIEGVPEEYASTPAERIRLYQQITQQLTARQANNRCATVASLSVDMPWNVLSRNPAYQRDQVVNPNQIAQIVNNWDPTQCFALQVAMIPVYDDSEQLVDVLFEVADGWNRRTSLVQLQFAQDNVWFLLTCEVTPCESQAQAAVIFGAANNADKRKQTKTTEQWRALNVALQPDVVNIVAMAAEYGLDARCQNRYRRWPCIDFGFAIRSMLADSHIGEEVVRCVLERYGNEALLGLRAPKVEHVPHMLSTQMFVGFAKFTAMFEQTGFAHEVVLLRMLSDPAFQLRLRYQLETMSMETIAKALGFSVSRQNEQHIRQWKVVAALVMMYEDFVTKPRSSKQSLWPECPIELRTLFHSIRHEEDEQRRVQRVAQMHRTLIRMNLPPRFEVRAVRPITR